MFNIKEIRLSFIAFYIFSILLFVIFLGSCEKDANTNKGKKGLQKTEINNNNKGLKKYSYNELKWIVRSISKNVDSLTILNKNEISKYVYITEKFEVNEIDSIEFYGSHFILNKCYSGLPTNTLLIVYFNNSEKSNHKLNLIIKNWKEYRGDGGMFKAGGMAFVLKGQLCIFKINVCRKGFKSVEKIDSLIQNKVFNNKSFFRIHFYCGLYPPVEMRLE